jgi:type IV pilus assembly protein PilP
MDDRYKSVGIGLAVAAAVLLLAGCSSSNDDMRSYIATVLSRPPGPIEPIPEIREAESFAYNPQGLRDPFARQQQEVADTGSSGDGPRPDPDRRKEFLERFPLDTLEMVGTLGQQNEVWGLVQDTDGVVHRVSEGNYLGQNHGRIAAVLPDRIILVELLPDGGGSWLEREATLQLSDADNS